MLALIQRVSHARVQVLDEEVGAIGTGLLVFLAVERKDTESIAERMLERLLSYRVFADGDGRMNLSLRDINGGLLLVPQFTLAADTRRGNRPSFTPCAEPEFARGLFACIVNLGRRQYPNFATGRFGADMQVHLVNDGPVTFQLKVADETGYGCFP